MTQGSRRRYRTHMMKHFLMDHLHIHPRLATARAGVPYQAEYPALLQTTSLIVTSLLLVLCHQSTFAMKMTVYSPPGPLYILVLMGQAACAGNPLTIPSRVSHLVEPLVDRAAALSPYNHSHSLLFAWLGQIPLVVIMMRHWRRK